MIVFTADKNPFVEKEAHAAGAAVVISKSEDVAVLIQQARTLFDPIAA